jgi:ABC-type branched-subunit amino acid transport system ATPase component
MRTLSGLKSADSGSATWNDHNLLHGKPEHHVRQGVSHVSEGKSVVAQLSVEENLDLGALWRRNPAEAKKSKAEVFELFPRLHERREQQADTLSGGERRCWQLAVHIWHARNSCFSMNHLLDSLHLLSSRFFNRFATSLTQWVSQSFLWNRMQWAL